MPYRYRCRCRYRYWCRCRLSKKIIKYPPKEGCAIPGESLRGNGSYWHVISITQFFHNNVIGFKWLVEPKAWYDIAKNIYNFANLTP